MTVSSESPWRLITGGDVVLADGAVIENGSVLIRQGLIEEVSVMPPASLLLETEDVDIIDATGKWVTPGLIDQHLHGAFGVDFNQSSREEIHSLLSLFPHHGITAVLPTVMTAPRLDMITALTHLEEIVQTQQKHQARVFGIHIEGPFLSHEYRGAHPKEDLLPIVFDNLEGLFSPSVKRITLAPELEGAERLISMLTAQGVLCSIGHSGASFNEALKAIQAGACCATHLFNAMGKLHHRDPGILTAALIEDDVYVEIIADGLHISPPVVQLALKAKPLNKPVLISDCNSLTGMAHGSEVRFGNQTVTIQDQGALNEDGMLAGSTMLVSDGVRNLVRWNILDFPHAVQLATSNPARHLGESALFGEIKPGAMADLLLWNQEDLSIESVFMTGEVIR